MSESSIKHKKLTEQEWRSLCSEWEASKQAQKKFCAERDISYPLFVNWRSKILAERGETRGNKFRAVTVSKKESPTPQSCLILKIPNGITLHITPNTPKSSLSMTLEVLGVLSC